MPGAALPGADQAEGVTVNLDWEAMGMRGTGSGTVVFKDVFIAEGAVSLRRPRAKFHPVYNIIVGCAMPLIMSVYVGVAETAAERALTAARKRGAMPLLLGEMQNHLTVAQLTRRQHGGAGGRPRVRALERIQQRHAGSEDAGGQRRHRDGLEGHRGCGRRGIPARNNGIERLLRDAYASQFHPLPERKQQEFTGRLMLGLTRG